MWQHKQPYIVDIFLHVVRQAVKIINNIQYNIGLNIELHSSMRYKNGLATMSLLYSGIINAQDSSRTAGEIFTEKSWYMQSWVWVVGGIAVLLILISLFSKMGKNKNTTRTDRVIITKTVRTETDINN